MNVNLACLFFTESSGGLAAWIIVLIVLAVVVAALAVAIILGIVIYKQSAKAKGNLN